MSTEADAARAAAERFLAEETQFQLGILPTEQSHPRTRGLAQALQRDTAAGIRLLQVVDEDVEGMARRLFREEAYAALVRALGEAFRGGRRVCFSGCGATGRLSILLEACWRRRWADLAVRHPASAARCRREADAVLSLMTGGDYALVRSVENFEDYASFGRRQVADAGLGRGDVLVAVSEGGETSSVLGTALEALDRGLRTFFAFNNPADLLSRHLERCRRVIRAPGVTLLDLSTGPMAVAGSTRMQAVTAELLVLGSALEEALLGRLRDVLPAEALAALPQDWWAPVDRAETFARLLGDLAAPEAVKALTDWTETECALYARGGRVTYFADAILLDLFTDTTERAPTFMLPPFRKRDDRVSPPSWAFVKNPALPTEAAWERILGRPPRCLEWDAAVYQALQGPPAARTSPPALGKTAIHQFAVGNEEDASRHDAPDSLAIVALGHGEWNAVGGSGWWDACLRAARPFRGRMAVTFGGTGPDLPGVERWIRVPFRIPPTPLDLWQHLGVKLALNTVSTATMGCLGRLMGNWMAHVETTNKKLIDRGSRLVSELAGVEYRTACIALHEVRAELAAAPAAGRERPSPVAETIRRLRQGA